MKLLKSALVLITITTLLFGYGQTNNSCLVIAKGESLVLRKKTISFKQVIIKGELILDKKSTILSNEILVDGGSLIAELGDEKTANGFSILLKKFLKTDPTPKLTITNGASVTLRAPFEWSSSEELKTGAIIRSTHGGYIMIEKPLKAFFEGIRFEALGTGDNPGITWYEDFNDSNGISNCFFEKSGGTDLLLDKTSISVVDNLFKSQAGSSVNCSPSGIGENNDLSHNLIINTSNRSLASLQIGNPFQSIRKNRIYSEGPVSGIVLNLPEGYDNYLWDKSPDNFRLDSNVIIRKISEVNQGNSPACGLSIDNFLHNGLWASSRNTVTGFDIGALLRCHALMVTEHDFFNNATGIITGSAYIQNSIIDYKESKQRSESAKAILITSNYGDSTPKISDVRISHYPTGVLFEGHVGPNHYLDNVTFGDVSDKMAFRDFNGHVYVKNMSYPRLIAEKPNHEGHSMNAHHGHHHRMPVKDTALVLFSEKSFLRSEKDLLLAEDSGFYYAAYDDFGLLTISTGLGLSDPVHEHSRNFDSLKLTNNFNKQSQQVHQTNSYSLTVASENIYDLNYKEPHQPIYDISLSWESQPKSWIIIKFKYDHDYAFGMRSFGGLVTPVSTYQDLLDAERTTFYQQQDTNLIYAKIYAANNHDHIVIYSSRVTTEIELEGFRVPVQLTMIENNSLLQITYDLPKPMYSELSISDYYGQTVKTLYSNLGDSKRIEVEVSSQEIDFINKPYFYTLTVGNQVHKGPLHEYRP